MSTFPNANASGQGPRPKPGPQQQDQAIAIDPIKLLKKYAWLLSIVAAAGVILGGAFWFLLLMVAPKYTAEAFFEVVNQVDPSDLGKAQTIDADEIELFMATQRDNMLSERVLRSVLGDSRLQREAPAFFNQVSSGGVIDVTDALEELEEEILSARIVQGTYAIRLAAQHSDAVSAAGLVSLVQETYLSNLERGFVNDINVQKEAIDRTISTLNQRKANQIRQRDQLISDQSLTSLDTDRAESRLALDSINQELLEIRGELESISVPLQRYEEMLTSDTGIQYTDTQIAMLREDPQIQQLQAQLSGLEAERTARLREGLKAQHRTIKRLDAEISAVQQEIETTREEQLRTIFDGELDSYRQVSAQFRAQEADLLDEKASLTASLVDLTRIIGEVEEIDRNIESLENEISEREADFNELDQQKDLEAITRIRVAENARVPDQISFPKIEVIVPVILFLTLGLAAAAILVAEVLDQRVKSASDLSMVPGAKPIGVIPDAEEDPTDITNPQSVVKDAPSSVLAEHYRQLRATILKAMDHAGHRSLLVAGCQPRSGATSIISNLAYAMHGAGRRVLLVDANFRRPSLNTLATTSVENGLAELLSGRTTFDDTPKHTLQPGLDLITAGARSERRFENLGSDAMTKFLAEASDEYDLVLLDVAPAVVSGDAASIANRADASILVVRALAEKRGMVARLKNELTDTRSEFLGSVVNGVRSAAGGYLRKNIMTAHSYQQDELETPSLTKKPA